jgi:hypothetical protein
MGNYHDHGEIHMPYHRPVYPLDAYNRKMSEPGLIAIDIVRLGFGSA